MTEHNPEPFNNETLYEFLRQSINSIIAVCQASGDSTQLNNIATTLNSLKSSMHDHAGQVPSDYFPD